VLDHLLIFSARHLEAVINEFLVHYHQARPHQGLEQRCADPGPAIFPLPVSGKIVRHAASEGYSTGTPEPPDRADWGKVRHAHAASGGPCWAVGRSRFSPLTGLHRLAAQHR
jgi:hypothetical protein